MKRLVLALPIILAGCATQAVPGALPPTLAQDAAECGIALALAGVMGGSSGIPGAIAATPACLRLPADILAQVEGHATVQANRALRQMRRVNVR